jgi:hypothetical protein
MSESARSGPSAKQNLIGGALAVVFGGSVLAVASHYPMGSLLRMGPGFFPCLIAALIVLLGAMLFVSGFRATPHALTESIRWRSVLAIGAGIVLFAVLLQRAGLIPATLVLVLVSSLAEPRWRPRRVALLALAVTALVYLLFVTVLQIPVPAVSF